MNNCPDCEKEICPTCNPMQKCKWCSQPCVGKFCSVCLDIKKRNPPSESLYKYDSIPECTVSTNCRGCGVITKNSAECEKCKLLSNFEFRKMKLDRDIEAFFRNLKGPVET